ncbi:MAG: YeiH family protein [Bacteroidota bacterium]
MERKSTLNEDWSAVAVASVVIIVLLTGFKPSLPTFNWTNFDELKNIFGDFQLWTDLSILWAFVYASTVGGLLLKGDKFTLKSLAGYSFIFVLALLAQIITGNSKVKDLGLEIVLFSLLIGLFISNITKVPEWVKPMIQTEFYIKIGLVLLGCGIIFKDIMQAGALGLIQSVAVVFVVWEFSFWLCRWLKIDDELRTMLSSAVAICGVSAAIATAGVIKGDGKKLSYVISLVLITAIPMMLIMPIMAKSMGLSNAVAGAWMGGTIDTTGAVVAAGNVLGDEGLKYATVVKFSQNVLLGLAAFMISIYWAYAKNQAQERPSAKTIWERFPKFVLGFILSSLVFSFLLSADTIAAVKGPVKGLQTFWFALAFICIGLETRFVDIFKMDSGRPAFAFLLAQLFNVVFTLIMAWLIFS